MDILQTTQIYNLDAIPDDAIITATVDQLRIITSKAQLFGKLGKVSAKRTAPVKSRLEPKATRVKSEKA